MEFTSDLTVELVQCLGSDALVAASARVSTGLDLSQFDQEADAKLVRYLMRNRHTSPFEHGSFTFRVDAPIFVMREFMRHRTFSFNETSGRYRELEPKFYVYPEDRPLVQKGTGAHPKLEEPGGYLNLAVNGSVRSASHKAWREYQWMIEQGAALEVARAVLPVGIYSSVYATVDPLNLMKFLSRRIDHPGNRVSTKPQWEIQKVAEQMEEVFKDQMPASYAAWVESGRDVG